MSSNCAKMCQDVPEEGNTSTSSDNVKKPIHPAKFWCGTLNNYTDTDICAIVPTMEKIAKKYIFTKEVGESGTPHLQFFVEFIKKCRPMKLLFDGRAHWEKCKGSEEQNIKYCTKTDGDQITNIRFPPKIKIIEKLYPWQKEIEDIVLSEPDDRSVHWYWEEKGCEGKTALCKYLAVKYNALVVSGKVEDIQYGVVAFTEGNDNIPPKIILVDIPRVSKGGVSYAGLEKVKDGLFFCGKYESKQFIMNSPHVICFANEPPREERMSEDRWKIKEIASAT